jgi:TonB family protein
VTLCDERTAFDELRPRELAINRSGVKNERMDPTRSALWRIRSRYHHSTERGTRSADGGADGGAPECTAAGLTDPMAERARHPSRALQALPDATRSRGEQGTATVAFTIDRDGRLVSSRIVQSSGSPLLDEETLAMLVRAQPMPKPPSTAPDSGLLIAVPVRFDIK